VVVRRKERRELQSRKDQCKILPEGRSGGASTSLLKKGRAMESFALGERAMKVPSKWERTLRDYNKGGDLY
jgi:hypothetical protein